MSIVGVNYSLADFRSGKKNKVKSKLSVPKSKVWSTFSKVVGVGNAHKNFMLSQILLAKTLAVWRLNTTARDLRNAIA